eukprot:14706.XXX_434603_434752_1 [CDS] Oithona nana genome sequencing.
MNLTFRTKCPKFKTSVEKCDFQTFLDLLDLGKVFFDSSKSSVFLLVQVS